MKLSGLSSHTSTLQRNPRCLAVCRGVVLFGTMLIQAQQASGRFLASADGRTVHDNVLHVTWLADANLPAKQKFSLPIRDSGVMNFATAKRWVAALNAGAYLGRTNWTMPAPDDGHELHRKRSERQFVRIQLHGERDGIPVYRASAYDSRIPRSPSHQAASALSVISSHISIGPRLERRPTSPIQAGEILGGFRVRTESTTFSFNTGWHGGNVSNHVMYVLPMIAGPLPGTTRCDRNRATAERRRTNSLRSDLERHLARQRQLAAEITFGVAGIVADGAMTRVTADAFIGAMNKHNRKGYLARRAGNCRRLIPIRAAVCTTSATTAAVRRWAPCTTSTC